MDPLKPRITRKIRRDGNEEISRGAEEEKGHGSIIQLLNEKQVGDTKIGDRLKEWNEK